MARDVDSCPHRSATEPHIADCRLLRTITATQERALSRVCRDLCEACCESFAPSLEALNPPLASALFSVARDILARGGLPGCDRERAIQLREWAEDNLAAGSDEAANPPGNGHADAVRQTPRRRNSPARVGLVGWNTSTGLGELNRQLARRLPVHRWLIPRHPYYRESAQPPPCPSHRDETTAGIDAFLDGLDRLLFFELPYLSELVGAARKAKLKIACVPMWEYLDEFLPWIRYVDLMICPTRACHEMILLWRDRLRLHCDIAYVPWPVDLDAFPFQPRTVCRRFLFVNGTGGLPTTQDQPAWDGRKGAAIVADAARLVPEIPILVRSQTPCLPAFPGNVEVHIAEVADPRELYAEGDVCLQPSRWEGLGLPLLECQASGLPLVTTDAAPMNEFQPWHTLECTKARFRLYGSRRIFAHDVAPAKLAGVMRQIHGSDIREASLAARRFVETAHSWDQAAERLRNLLS